MSFQDTYFLHHSKRKTQKRRLIDIYRETGLPKKYKVTNAKNLKVKVKKFFNGNGVKMINSAPYKPPGVNVKAKERRKVRGREK